MLRLFFPNTIWQMPGNVKKVYITFDDGPIPEVTPWVINCLKEHGAVATFFCVGDNIIKHPDIFKQLVENKMEIGNHTYSHKKAWHCSKNEYLKDADKFQEIRHTELFRPPHGQLYPWLIKPLKKRFSKIVMWNILSRDYNKNISDDDIINNVTASLQPGSIIVFHDSVKTWPKLINVLPPVLKEINKQGYNYGLFNNDTQNQVKLTI